MKNRLGLCFRRLRIARGGWLPVLLLLATTSTVQAQYNYTTNSPDTNTITITGYTGSGGAVTIPGAINGKPVTRIGEQAFYSCTSLTSITIPNSVISIADAAFDGCIRLTSITIPNSVSSVGYYAFCGCGLTNVVVGNNVTSIGDYAFWGCTSLTSVYFRGNAPSLGGPNVFDYTDNATVFYLPGTTGWGSTFADLPTILWGPQVSGDSNFGVRTNTFGFNMNWVGGSGMVIVVEACTNLANFSWVPLQTNTLISDSSYFSDPRWTNYCTRFYRLRMP